MINNTLGPLLNPGQFVKCKKQGWFYKVVEILPAVEGRCLERYRLEIADNGAMRSCSLQDVVARACLLERYTVSWQKNRKRRDGHPGGHFESVRRHAHS